MKKTTFLLTVILLFTMTYVGYSQTPNGFSYQAVVRNTSNQIMLNQNVGIRLSILKTSASGNIIFSESHTVSTNQFGMVNLFVGDGSLISGNFSTINWGNDLYYLKVDVDINGGSNYQFMGTTQLLSVPYSLHSNTADSLVGGIIESDPVFGTSVANAINQADTANWNSKLGSYTETDPIFGASVANAINQTDTANWNSKLDNFTEADPFYNNSVASSITQSDTLRWSNKLDAEVDGDSSNELQFLSFSNDTLYLSQGNQVYLGDSTGGGSGGYWQQIGNNIYYNTGHVGINTNYDEAMLQVEETNQSDTTTAIFGIGHGGKGVFGLSFAKTNQNWMNVGVQGNADIQSGFSGRGVGGAVYGSGLMGYGIRGEASLDTGFNVGASGVGLSNNGNTSNIIGGEFSAIPNWDTSKGSGMGYNYGVWAEGKGKYRNRGLIAKAVGTDTNSLSYGALIYANNDVLSSEPAIGVYSWANNSSNTNTGVLGSVFSSTGQYNNGGVFEATGTGHSSLETMNYGIQSLASNNREKNYGVYSKAEGAGARNSGVWSRAQGSDNAASNYGGEFFAYNDVPTSGWNIGIVTKADSSTYINRGLESQATSNTGQWNYAGIFFADGTGNPTQSTQNIGLYGIARNNRLTNYGIRGLAHGGSNPSAFVTGIIGEANGAGGNSGYGIDGTNAARNKKNVGIGGFAYGSVSGDSVNMAIYGYVANADTNYAIYADAIYTGQVNYGLYAEAANGTVANHAGFFEGDVTVTGNLNVVGSISKGSGTFKIDHPTDPENKYLVHSFVESPEMMNVYSGNITTDTNGFATVVLPDYFSAANKDFRYQLTCIGVFAQAIVKDEILGNTFVVQTSLPNVKISWQVTAVRNDKYAQQNRITPVQDKAESEQGKYLHPELYGKSVDSRVYTKHSSGGAEMMKTKLENKKKAEEADAMSATQNDAKAGSKKRSSSERNSNSTNQITK